MIRFLLEGDTRPRYGTAERMDLDGAIYSLKEIPSGTLVPTGTSVRVLALDPHELPRIEQSGLVFVGGIPTPNPADASRWVAERVRAER